VSVAADVLGEVVVGGVVEGQAGWQGQVWHHLFHFHPVLPMEGRWPMSWRWSRRRWGRLLGLGRFTIH
jgi:hypothetical protein